jgi:hypothetical protein
MDKIPIDIVEDDLSRVVELELKGGLIGGKSKLISCFHRFNLLLLGQFYHVAGGEGTKRRLKSPEFEAKIKAFQN